EALRPAPLAHRDGEVGLARHVGGLLALSLGDLPVVAGAQRERRRREQTEARDLHRSCGTVEMASSMVDRPSLTLSRLSWWRVFIPWRMAIFLSSAVSIFLLIPSISSSFVTISSWMPTRPR